jgi:small-conductance mechanosensitive channel
MKAIITAFVLSLVMAVTAFPAATEMTYEQYEQELATAQNREKVAKEGIAQEQAAIESLKQQIADIDQRIAAVMQEKYQILGITEQDVLNAENEIASIKQEIQLLMGLSPDELAKRINDIKKLEARIADLKKKPVSYLWRIAKQVKDLDDMMAQLKSRLPDKPNQYEVRLIPERRDCLYRIAGYDNIFNDPAQWPKIYRANKPAIDGKFEVYQKNTSDPKYTRSEDLIYPGQMLDIPR